MIIFLLFIQFNKIANRMFDMNNLLKCDYFLKYAFENIEKNQIELNILIFLQNSSFKNKS